MAPIWNYISNEIERYYIPRPRFEDGEPVQASDLEEIGWLATCCVFTDGSWRFDPAKFDDERNSNPWDEQRGTKDDRIKRPTPKVLDADGLEIKVGQKRWSVESDNEYDILEIKPDGSLVKCGCPNKGGEDLFVWLAPSQLTHEKPVFDAEGVRICKGDTVWDEDGSYVVTNLAPDKRLKVCTDGENGGGWVSAELLTHHEWDSLEKLRDDISKHVRELHDIGGDASCSKGWLDRLTAIIERGA